MGSRAGRRRHRLVSELRETRVDVEGGTLLVAESGDGPPLVMLHGWALDRRMFGPQVECLSGVFRVITFDRRGFGRSDAPPDLRLELDDIDRVLDALELDTMHLLGMSQGGRIAIRYAVTRGDRLRSLLLQGAVIDGFRAAEEEAERVPVAEYAALVRAGRLDDVRERWQRHPMMALGPQADGARELVKEIVAGYEGRDLVAHESSGYHFDIDVLAALQQLDVPTLVLTGRDETLARRRHAQELCRRIPVATEALIDGGHLCNLVAPDAYNRAVREFCEATEAARRDQEAALRIE